MSDTDMIEKKEVWINKQSANLVLVSHIDLDPVCYGIETHEKEELLPNECGKDLFNILNDRFELLGEL